MKRLLLQLFHISDLHVVLPSHLVDEWLYYEAKVKGGSRNPIVKMLADGLAPYEAHAIEDMVDFIVAERSLEAPNWLACTGDLTTWGDDPSMAHALDSIRDLESEGLRVLLLHGNHDAWPAAQPLYQQAVQRQRTRLRARREFADVLPCAPAALGASPIDVQVYSLNTVVHDWRNFFALGEVQEDQYWRSKGSPDADVQLDALDHVSTAALPASGRVLRIVLTHHPVVAQPDEDVLDGLGLKMVLVNRSVVAQRLGVGDPLPRYHLVLSGHTHAVSPLVGRVILSTVGSQLVVGSPSQSDSLRQHDALAQNLQMLQVYDVSNGTGHEVAVVRKVAARAGVRAGGSHPGFSWLKTTDVWRFQL